MRRHWAGKALGSALVAVALAATPSTSAREVDVVDLRTAPSWLVTGASTIGPVGDVNGDSVADVAVADCGSGEGAGEVRIVAGPFEPGEAVFEDVDEGFAIRGAQPEDTACRLSPHSVGDVNGDGLADVVVAADRPSRAPSTVYVVFGKRDSDTVELRAFDEGTQGSRGYVVHKWNGWYIGVTGVGDMNQDGLADFAVGGGWGGKTYVVFGQSLTTPVDLRTFDVAAGRGFLITNRCRECVFGFAGDVNGDAVPDVAVGGVGRKRYEGPGSAYVVFGKRDPLPVDTTKRTPQSFKIRGDSPSGFWDGAISAAGDVNGDGLGDLIAGLPKAYSCCHGKVAVIFGKTDSETVHIADLGAAGFQVLASQETDRFGTEAVGIGDVNADGLSDIAVGADFHRYAERRATGAVFVVYGSRSPHDLRTGRLGKSGYVIVGREYGDWTGYGLGAPGDMDGDGTADLLISAISGWGVSDEKAYLLWL